MSEDRQVKCPIPKDVLLEMVREEAKLRTSKEFQEKVAKEEKEANTDGTKSIVALQVCFESWKVNSQTQKMFFFYAGKHCH